MITVFSVWQNHNSTLFQAGHLVAEVLKKMFFKRKTNLYAQTKLIMEFLKNNTS